MKSLFVQKLLVSLEDLVRKFSTTWVQCDEILDPLLLKVIAFAVIFILSDEPAYHIVFHQVLAVGLVQLYSSLDALCMKCLNIGNKK